MAKYAMIDEDITVDGQPVAQIEILPGDLNGPRLVDMIAAANRSLERRRVPQIIPTSDPNAEVSSGLLNDLDDAGAATFLVKHYVPFIGPDMGTEIIKILKRLEMVATVYPLPPTVEAYRLSLHLMLQVAAHHQEAFCTMMEGVLAE